MSAFEVSSVLSRALQLADRSDEYGNTIIPFEDVSIYSSLCNEMSEDAATAASSALCIILDHHTANMLERFDRLCDAAQQVYVFGDAPPQPGSDNVHYCPSLRYVSPLDRFMIVYSEHVSVATVGKQEDGALDGRTFLGAWTSHRSYVRNIAAMLFELCEQPVPALPNADGEAVERNSAVTMRLMALLTRELFLLRTSAAQGRHELFSVLEILKAISARRRSHDILYVFVEKIAKVIAMDRCSVVRVWGGGSQAHVLASHEDASVNNLVIDLDKYPEVQHALATRQKVIVDDVTQNPLTRDFVTELSAAQIRAVMVIPIVLFDPNVGSLMLRAARRTAGFTPREVSFCEIVAEAASNALERAHLFETIQRANERLELLAVTDGLTGLHNHRHFRDRLEEEFDRARRYGTPLSCLIFDVDNFKRLNDTYGHLQGDSVLREMAERVTTCVRKSDVVARYGGEEFTVILPQTGVVGAEAEAERIRRTIADTPFKGLGPDSPVTVSVGVAIYDSETMLDCETLLRVADGALYEAKRSGKNRVVVGTGEARPS